MAYALIVCHGEPPPLPLLMERAAGASLLVAADGGYLPLAAAGLKPDVLVGDLDTVRPPYPDGMEVIRDGDQEINDLEKALELVRARRHSHVVVLGATGRRVDQTLKNLSVLQKYDIHFRSLVFEDAHCSLYVAQSGSEISVPLGTVISLFPISGTVEDVVTQGLKYPLHAETLKNGSRDGSSNEVVSLPASVRYRTGCLLLIINRTEGEDL